MNEQDLTLQQQDEQQRGVMPPAVTNHVMSLAEKAKYGLIVGGAAGLGLEVVGASATGLAIAAMVGIGAAYFSEEIRGSIIDKLPAPRSATSRQSKLDWWFDGGQPPTEKTVVLQSEGEITTEPLRVEPGGVLEATAIEAAEMQQGPAAQPVFPLYPENETLRLGHVVATGQRFDPHVNGLLGQGLIAAAMQGWGKSQLVGRIVEQCGKCGMMVVLFDHKGEHETITDLPYINGLRVGGDASADFQLTTDNAAELVQLVMKKRHQAVINLPSYGIKWLDRAKIVSAVARELMNYAEEKRRKRERVMPCLVLLDEAQLYIPQDPKFLPPEAQSNKDILGELTNSFFALVTNGRSAGYTVGFATQSLTFISKAMIKSCAIQVLGRHVEKNALDMCEDIIDDDNVATRAEVKTFPKGKGVLFGFTEDPLVVQFDKKESRDLSETPTIEWLREPEKPAVPQASAASPSGDLTSAIERIVALYEVGKIDQDTMFQLIERLPGGRSIESDEEPDTGDLIPEVIDFQVEQARRVVPAPSQQPSAPRVQHAKYQKALAAWNAGHQSVRSLAPALDITESAAYKLMTDMDKLGLIQMKRKVK